MVPKSFFAKYLPSTLVPIYKKYLYQSFTNENKTLRWCPFPNCNFLVENLELVAVDIHCKCGKVFCFSCGEPSHIPATCEMLRKWTIKTSSESENINWILANTKQCPKCNKPIEKMHGCNHMSCSQCKYEFCWVCTGSWKLHGNQTGGYYKCNRFEAEDPKSKKKEKAKTKLAKYTFYFERYNNHGKAMKLAVTQANEMDEKIKKLHINHNLSLTGLEFLQNAANAMIEIRNTLKYSYVYAYYLKDLKEKALFEHVQGNLEENGDKLHQLLEKGLGEFIRSKEGKGIHTEFYKYKEELSNYYSVTKKVRNLIENNSSFKNSVKE